MGFCSPFPFSRNTQLTISHKWPNAYPQTHTSMRDVNSIHDFCRLPDTSPCSVIILFKSSQHFNMKIVPPHHTTLIPTLTCSHIHHRHTHNRSHCTAVCRCLRSWKFIWPILRIEKNARNNQRRNDDDNDTTQFNMFESWPEFALSSPLHITLHWLVALHYER